MAADERGSGQAYWRALAVSSALPCACMHARACACSARARHALHARTLETLNGGWPGGRDGGGRARLPQTAARCAAERWPCHLRCHARACTRARSARMRAREKSIGMAPDEHGCSGQACCRALDTSSALSDACHTRAHARPLHEHGMDGMHEKTRPGRWQGRPYTHTRVWRTARSIARDHATPCALLFLPLRLLRAVSRCCPVEKLRVRADRCMLM